jgi:hypothetical protein
MTSYKVFENNAGGLELVVWSDDGRCIYRHVGYEHTSTSRHDGVARDVLDLHTGSDVALWGGNEIDELGAEVWGDYTDESRRSGGWQVVAEGDVGGSARAYPDLMGASAQMAFALVPQKCEHRIGDGCATSDDLEKFSPGDECTKCVCVLCADGYWYVERDQAENASR